MTEDPQLPQRVVRSRKPPPDAEPAPRVEGMSAIGTLARFTFYSLLAGFLCWAVTEGAIARGDRGGGNAFANPFSPSYWAGSSR